MRWSLTISDNDTEYLFVEAKKTNAWNSLSWFNKWILWLPMIASKRKRINKCCPTIPRNICQYIIKIFIFLSLCAMLFARIERTKLEWMDLKGEGNLNFKKFSEWLFTWKGLFDTVWLFANIADFVSRTCSMYYFYKHFNFPWFNCVSMPKPNQMYIRKIKMHCRLLHFFFILLFILYSFKFILDDIRIINNVNSGFPFCEEECQFISTCIIYLTSMWPRIVNVIVVAIIFLKYHIYLSQLNEHVQLLIDDKSKIVYSKILHQFEQIYKEYKKDYHDSLNWCIQICLLDLIFFQYRNVYKLVMEKNLKLIPIIAGNMLMYVPFAIYALKLTESYNLFKQLLFESARGLVGDDKVLMNQIFDYHYTSQYAHKHNMEISLGKVTVTRQSIINFASGLLITKFMACIFIAFYEKLFKKMF